MIPLYKDNWGWEKEDKHEGEEKNLELKNKGGKRTHDDNLNINIFS